MTADRKTDFEGAPLPAGEALRSALCGDPAERAHLVRAAVVDVEWAGAVIEACETLIEAREPRAVAAALAVSTALVARGLVPLVAQTLMEHRDEWVSIPDPIAPDQSLAATALDFLAKAALPRDARVIDVFVWALDVESLCRVAWRRLGQRAPEDLIPMLPKLLSLAPDLADEVGTVFALVHGELVIDAARAIAPMDPAVRDPVAAAMEKHLYRIRAVRRWVACRRALTGK